jgi:hypothetical protein
MPITHEGEQLAMQNALGTGTTTTATVVRLHSSNPGTSVGAGGLITGFTAATNNSGGTVSINGQSYPRTAWNFQTNGTETTNVNTISFTRTDEDPVTVTHISILKGATNPSTYVWYAPVGSITWSKDQTIEFPAGSIKLNLSNNIP